MAFEFGLWTFFSTLVMTLVVVSLLAFFRWQANCEGYNCQDAIKLELFRMRKWLIMSITLAVLVSSFAGLASYYKEIHRTFEHEHFIFELEPELKWCKKSIDDKEK